MIKRSLPVRVSPIVVTPWPGEALDSWLEAISRRLDTPITHMPSLGMSPGHRETRRWVIALRDAEAEGLALVTATAVPLLHAMTLARWHGTAVHLNLPVRQVEPKMLWGRETGSRFCPACLAETDGRWQLSWRLGWSFACVAHLCLLLDSCPACDRIPRVRQRYSRIAAPGTCDAIATSGGRSADCGFALHTALPLLLAADSPLLATQQLIDTLLSQADPHTTRFSGVFGTTPVAVRQIFADFRALASRYLDAPLDPDSEQWVPPQLLQRRETYLRRPLFSKGRRDVPRQRLGFHGPLDAATAGLSLVRAAATLTAPTTAAAKDSAVWLMEHLVRSNILASPSAIGKWAIDISGVLSAVLAGAAPHHLARRWERLSHRSTLDVPAPAAARPPVNHDTRATQIPAMLWEYWSVQLIPHDYPRPRTVQLRQSLSASLMQVGTRISMPDVIQLLAVRGTKASALGNIVNKLHSHRGGTDVLRALTMLADQLDSCPIDYTRRRAVFGCMQTFVDPGHWAAIQQRTGYPHGTPKSLHHAQCWLHEILTGSPPAMAHPAIAATHRPWPRSCITFRFRMHPAEVSELLDLARDLLAQAGIDEPVTWHPQLTETQLAEVRLPGADLSTIQPQQVHDLIHAGRNRLVDLAADLATTQAHVRYLIETYPVSRQVTADRYETVTRWAQAVADGVPMRRLAKLDHASEYTISQAMRRLGVPIAPAHAVPKYDSYSGEVIRRYTGGETLAEIGRVTGLEPATVRNLLIRARVPRRRSGPRRNKSDGGC